MTSDWARRRTDGPAAVERVAEDDGAVAGACLLAHNLRNQDPTDAAQIGSTERHNGDPCATRGKEQAVPMRAQAGDD